MSWFESISDAGTAVFGWLKKNPVAADFVAGAGVAMLEDKQQRSRFKQEQKLYSQRRESEMAKHSGGNPNYDLSKKQLIGGKGLLRGQILEQ